MPRIRILPEKLQWRIELFVDRRGIWSLWERLQLAAPRERRPDIRTLLMKRRRIDTGGAPYFDINGLKLYYQPPHPVADQNTYLECILLILKEAYINPPDFQAGGATIHPGDVVLDLGGNIGTSALTFSKQVGASGRVYTFEPVFHDVLARNLAVNHIDNVTLVPQGVADRPGRMDIHVADTGIDSSIAREPGSGRAATWPVEVTTLDRFVEEAGLERVNFIKVDIEGAEEAAIRGAEGVIRRFRPRWSIASYHTDFEGERQHPKLVKLLRKLGYEVRETAMRRIHAWSWLLGLWMGLAAC